MSLDININFAEGTQGIQYPDVTRGNLYEISKAIIQGRELIVRDDPEGAYLDVASIFDSAVASLESLFGKDSDQQERVIAAINSFYSHRRAELIALPPKVLERLAESLENIQKDLGPGMMKDVSMGDHAGHDERQRMMPKNSCLETAIANVQAAMAQLNSQDLFELVAADKEPGAASEDISDDFLLLVEEDESVEVRAQPPQKGSEADAERLQAIFKNEPDEDVDFRQKR